MSLIAWYCAGLAIAFWTPAVLDFLRGGYRGDAFEPVEDIDWLAEFRDPYRYWCGIHGWRQVKGCPGCWSDAERARDMRVILARLAA